MARRKTVLEVRRASTNRHQWTLLLGCGHQVTITTRGRPTKKGVRCHKCQRMPERILTAS